VTTPKGGQRSQGSSGVGRSTYTKTTESSGCRLVSDRLKYSRTKHPMKHINDGQRGTRMAGHWSRHDARGSQERCEGGTVQRAHRKGKQHKERSINELE
jgi:hypothetical protein